MNIILSRLAPHKKLARLITDLLPNFVTAHIAPKFAGISTKPLRNKLIYGSPATKVTKDYVIYFLMHKIFFYKRKLVYSYSPCFVLFL